LPASERISGACSSTSAAIFFRRPAESAAFPLNFSFAFAPSLSGSID
jgi:hypothetical protein